MKVVTYFSDRNNPKLFQSAEYMNWYQIITVTFCTCITSHRVQSRGESSLPQTCLAYCRQDLRKSSLSPSKGEVGEPEAVFLPCFELVCIG